MNKIEQILSELREKEEWRMVTWGGCLTEAFNSDINRYDFDSYLIWKGKKWFQVDNRQDFEFYWNWVNIEEKLLVSYAEWDIYYVVFDSEEWLGANLKEMKEYGYQWIDGWTNKEDIAMVEAFMIKYDIPAKYN